MTESDRTHEEKLLIDFMRLMVDGLSQTFGARSEVVLHDLGKGEQSIAKISNSYVSGRTDYDAIDHFKLDVLCNQSDGDAQINYPSVSSTGKYLKSTSILIRDQKDEPMAVLCVNIDMSDFLGMHYALQDMFGISKNDSDLKTSSSGEVVVKTVDLVTTIIRKSGKPVMSLTQEEKLQIVQHLHQSGYFLKKGAVKMLAAKLMVSKSTVYNYLERVKAQLA